METRKILIVTKTYPEISKKYGETVCTAGLLLDDDEKPMQWVRIYPVRYRDLDFDQRYPRWGIIQASIERNQKDYREESYRINDQTIKLLRKLDTKDQWEERRKFFEPFLVPSIEQIKAQGESLGLIRPHDVAYSYEESDREWTSSKQAVLDQYDLLNPKEPGSDLEKIPYKFFYKFNDSTGKHRCSIIDWEICQLYRKMRETSKMHAKESKEKEALEKVRIKLADWMPQTDLHFLMGNLKMHKDSFVIIGLIYPPFKQPKQLSLADLL
jgi:hypothetical protein